MPRVTRKALAEGPTDPPTRSSARASTKASTTSSRTSRSTTAASPSPARGSRSRRSKSPVKEDEEEEEEEVVETKRTGRGRQAGDAAEEDVKPAGRSRSNAKKGVKAEEPKVEPKKGGRSRSKAGKKEEPKEEEQEEEEQEEEAAAETTSRGRSRAKKSEAKPAAEGRSSRSMSKDSSVAESETAETGRGRSRGKKAPAESPANSRSSSRRGAKSEEPAEEAPETSQPRGRSRGKAAKPEPEAEPAGRNRRGKKAQSPSESVGSSRSSSRSRASKAQSEDVAEPEVKSRGRRGGAKAEEKAEEASTPTGRGGRRGGRKAETSPAPPAAKRRRGGKKDSPSVADELEPSEDQPVVQLEKIDDKVKDEENKRKAESKDESQEEEDMQVDESKDSAEKKSEDTVDTIPEPDQPEDKEAGVETPAKEKEPEVEKTDKPAEPEVPAKSTPAKEDKSIDETPVTKETKTEEAKPVEKSSVAQQVRIEVQPPSPVKEPEENGQKMELDGFDNKPLGQGKKRKLEDEEVEESETKRACVETNSAEVKDVPMEETQAPIQPAFEAVSDVSSAEEDVPAPPLNNYSSSAPAVVEPSKPDSQNNVVEMVGAKSEEATIDSQSSQKASAEIPAKEANGSADDDYVIINMEDVPSADSNLIKDSLPVHQNHSKQQNQEQQSMETDQSKPTQEQKTIPTSPVVPVIPNTEAPKTEISAPKPVRIFEPSPDIFHRTCVRNPSVGESVEPSATFSVVSYNILAECHRLRGDYSYTEEKFLSQNYRHDLLMKELKYLDADVVCLQEVDPDYYTSALLPALKSLGYEGSYMKRTWTEINEGEATFVKTSRFTVESAKGLSLSELAKKNMSESGLAPEVQTAIDEYLNRADVVNISRLRCKRTDKVLTLGNIHVVWDHLRSPDIQSIQIAVAVKELVHQAGSDSSPHILCGDFNSAPSSVGYQLAKDGYLSDANIATLQAVENLKLNTGSKALVNHLWGAFQHTSSNLSSAYKTCQDSEPDVTTFTCEMFSCVDYLFYGSVGLEVKDVLRTVDKHVVEETTGLPAEKIPSDHLSLKANFFFR